MDLSRSVLELTERVREKETKKIEDLNVLPEEF